MAAARSYRSASLLLFVIPRVSGWSDCRNLKHLNNFRCTPPDIGTEAQPKRPSVFIYCCQRGSFIRQAAWLPKWEGQILQILAN